MDKYNWVEFLLEPKIHWSGLDIKKLNPLKKKKIKRKGGAEQTKKKLSNKKSKKIQIEHQGHVWYTKCRLH